MTRLLAEDLLVLCWDTDRGTVAHHCADKLDTGIGGALVLDALRADVLTVRDGRAVATDVPAGDPLLDAVAVEAARGRRAPTVRSVVDRVGTAARRQKVINRLVDAGVLHREHTRRLWIMPVTRHHLTEPRTHSALTTAVAELLTGTRPPEDADTHHLLLAALAAPTGAIDVLIESSARKEARQRAERFTEGHGIPATVGQSIADTQLAIVAAVGTTTHITSSGTKGS